MITDQELLALEAEVLQQEALLGPTNPVVGKHWLALSKAYQEKDPIHYGARAEHALIRSCSTIMTAGI